MSEIAQYSPEWFANKTKEDQYVQFEINIKTPAT